MKTISAQDLKFCATVRVAVFIEGEIIYLFTTIITVEIEIKTRFRQLISQIYFSKRWPSCQSFSGVKIAAVLSDYADHFVLHALVIFWQIIYSNL